MSIVYYPAEAVPVTKTVEDKIGSGAQPSSDYARADSVSKAKEAVVGEPVVSSSTAEPGEAKVRRGSASPESDKKEGSAKRGPGRRRRNLARTVSNRSEESTASSGRRRSSQRQQKDNIQTFGQSMSALTLLRYNMSPETSLIEFISTSAAYHNVRMTTIANLEADLLTVFPHNIMPANAAAWYMSKRRYLAINPGPLNVAVGGPVSSVGRNYNLLTALLKSYPHKFTVNGNTVHFCETYSHDVARKKLSALIHQGLMAYFVHKAEEYGVYFFDPYYYESTEPFVSNLLHVTSVGNASATDGQIGNRGRNRDIVGRYFNANKDVFDYRPVSQYMVTIARHPLQTQIKLNVTCVITDIVEGANGLRYGILKFASDAGTDSKGGRRGNRKGSAKTEKALFPLKVLYRDGFVYTGDPLKLSAVEFDGYKIPRQQGASVAKNKNRARLVSKGQSLISECTWFAVLVWVGRKASPRFCANKDDLIGAMGNDLLSSLDVGFLSSSTQSRTTRSMPSLSRQPSYGEVSRALDHDHEVRQLPASPGSYGSSQLFVQPQRRPLLPDDMIIGQVVRIETSGAIVSTDLSLTALDKNRAGPQVKVQRQVRSPSLKKQDSADSADVERERIPVEAAPAEPEAPARDDGQQSAKRDAASAAAAASPTKSDPPEELSNSSLYYVPGWMHRQVGSRRGVYLTTRQGVEAGKGDVVAFDIENPMKSSSLPKMLRKERSLKGVGHNLIVIRRVKSVRPESVRKTDSVDGAVSSKRSPRGEKQKQRSKTPKKKARPLPAYVNLLLSDPIPGESESDNSDADSSYDPSHGLEFLAHDDHFDDWSDSEISEEELNALKCDLTEMDDDALTKLASEMGSGRQSGSASKPTSNEEPTDQDGSDQQYSREVDKLIEAVGGMTTCSAAK